MTRIRMVPDDVRHVAHGLGLSAANLEKIPADLKRIPAQISSAWQGGNADYYAREISRLAVDLQSEIENLRYLSSRLNSEVNEWERADSFGSFSSAVPRVFLPGAISPLLLFPASITYKNSPTPFWNGKIVKDWEAKLDVTVADKWTSSNGWEDDADFELGAKISLIEGVYKEGQSSSNWAIRNHDIGGVIGEYKVGANEAGLQFGVGEKGFRMGVYGEYSAIKTSGAAVLGSSLFGLTASVGGSAGSAQGFLGYQEGTVGASVGASVAAAEIGVGLNVAGANVGLKAGASLGFELGIKLGANTEVKAGPFKIGLTFGKAITD